MSSSLSRLVLTQRLAQWSGQKLPSEVTSTDSPDDNKVADLVAFVDQAWLDIQISQSNWAWMRHQLNDDSVALTADTRTLAMSAIDATCRTVVPFVIHNVSPSRYVLLKHPTTDAVHKAFFVNYEAFRGYLDRGTRPSNKPVRFTIRKNGDLEFDPAPDVAYKLNCDWMHVPVDLSANTDAPDMPNHFHMLVVWYAMVHLMNYDEKNGRYQLANREYQKMMNRLEIEQLPDVFHDTYLSNTVYGW